jgi:hypothetical protein
VDIFIFFFYQCIGFAYSREGELITTTEEKSVVFLTYFFPMTAMQKFNSTLYLPVIYLATSMRCWSRNFLEKIKKRPFISTFIPPANLL